LSFIRGSAETLIRIDNVGYNSYGTQFTLSGRLLYSNGDPAGGQFMRLEVDTPSETLVIPVTSLEDGTFEVTEPIAEGSYTEIYFYMTGADGNLRWGGYVNTNDYFDWERWRSYLY